MVRLELILLNHCLGLVHICVTYPIVRRYKTTGLRWLEYKKGNMHQSLMQDVEKQHVYADVMLLYGIKLGSVLISNQAGTALSYCHTETKLSNNNNFQ